MFQTASEALISACNYYVPSSEATFRTYASKCIDNKLKQYINPKKKRKKQEKDLEKIIKKEKDKIKFIKNCATYLIDRGPFHISDIESIHTYINSFNNKINNLGEFERRIYKQKNNPTDSYMNLFINYIKESFLPLLINEEDRELISLEANYKNVSRNKIIIRSFIEYVKIYEQRMDSIYDYIIATKILETDGLGIITKQDIMNAMNKQVKEFNSLVYYYKRKNPKDYPHQKQPTCYYFEYLKEYDIDFLNPDENNRATEIEKIRNEFDRDSYEYIKNKQLKLLDNLYKEKSSALIKYTLETYEDDLGYKIIYVSDYHIIDKREDKLIDEYICSVEELINIIKEKIKSQNNLTEDEYVKYILEVRKKYICNKVNKINEPIYEYNRNIETNREAYFRKGKYKKYYSLKDIELIEHYIGIMFNYNTTKMETLIKNDETRKKQNNLSTEDKACENIFLEDYYNSLSSLDELQKNILLLWFDEEGKHSMSAKEIADIVGISYKKVYKEKDKALKLLRKNTTLQSYLEY